MNFDYILSFERNLMQYLQVHNERVKQQVILSNHPHHQQIHQQTPVIMTTATTTTSTASQPPAPVKVQSSSKSKSSRKNTNSESSSGRGTPSNTGSFVCMWLLPYKNILY